MEKFSVSEIIEQAVRTEKLGYDFYTTMAGRFSQHQGLKDLFGKLAEQETLHEKRFNELKEKVSAENLVGWEEASEYLRAIVESEFFLGKHKSLPDLGRVTSVEEAIKFAIGFEKETLLYFYSLRDIVSDKGIVDTIIDEEKSHIVWLNGLLR